MTTTDSDESRLGRLEGQMEQLIITLQDNRNEHRTEHQNIREELRDIRQELRAVNTRIDRLFLATWAIGGGIIAALVVQIIRAG